MFVKVEFELSNAAPEVSVVAKQMHSPLRQRASATMCSTLHGNTYSPVQTYKQHLASVLMSKGLLYLRAKW